MSDETREPEVDEELTKDLDVGDEAEDVVGGVRTNPDLGGHLA
jgi:hypothetical protein